MTDDEWEEQRRRAVLAAFHKRAMDELRALIAECDQLMGDRA